MKFFTNAIPFSITPSPALLAYHFFSVAFYSIWVMFTHPHVVPAPRRIPNVNGHVNGDLKPVYATPRMHQYPALLVKSVRVVSLSFIPLTFLPISNSHLFLSSVLDSLCRLWPVAMDRNPVVVLEWHVDSKPFFADCSHSYNRLRGREFWDPDSWT